MLWEAILDPADGKHGTLLIAAGGGCAASWGAVTATCKIMSGQVIAKCMSSNSMNIEYRSPENHSQVTEQLFTDRIAIIDLPKEMWNEEGAPNVLAATPRQEPELLKSLGEHLEHAVTLVRPAASWV